MIFIKKAGLTFAFILFLWIGGFASFATASLLMKPQNPEHTSDAIVVLTGGQDRIETGLALFAAGRAPHLFITGVHPDVKKQDIVKKWTGETALPPCCITLGHQARSTAHNADETKSWLAGKGYHSIRLVTSNFHMIRSVNELRAGLPDIEILRHPIIQPDYKPGSWRFWSMMFVEYHKTIFRWPLLMLSIRKPELESLEP